MKIKVVSQDNASAEKLAQWVRDSGPGLDVQADGGASSAPLSAVNGNRPALLVLDGMDMQGLDAIGELNHMYPDVETIVISDEQSPAFLIKAMQVGVREVLPPPENGQALQAAVQRVARKRTTPATAAAPARQSSVFAFLSCKGGCGASFIAANLAHVLSVRDGRTAVLIDLDLQFGDTLLMLSDKRAASDVAEVARNIGRLDADLLNSAMVRVSDTLSVLPAPEELSQALEVNASHVEAIVRQARQMFDFVVLDIGRSIDAVSLQALDLSDGIFPVLQLSVPQVRDARRLSTLFRSLDYPMQKIHWVVNRFQKSNDVTLESLEQALATKDLTTVPNHYAAVSASINQGVPIERLARNNPVARALLELAQSIAPAEVIRKERWLASLFGH